MLQRWEGFAEMATSGMDELHPEEKAWKAIIASENKEKISEFTKHESLLLVGPISAATTNFVTSLNTFLRRDPYRGNPHLARDKPRRREGGKDLAVGDLSDTSETCSRGGYGRQGNFPQGP